jgi:hypothetical protein
MPIEANAQVRPLPPYQGRPRAQQRKGEQAKVRGVKPGRKPSRCRAATPGDKTLREIARSDNVGRTTTRRSTVSGLTADKSDRDMPHRRIGLGAMPMAFASLDVHDVTDIDLVLFALRGDHAGARSYN